MTVKRTLVSLICAECKRAIPAGSFYSVRLVPVKNLFNIPFEERAMEQKAVCLEHEYKRAEQKLNNKFFQLDLFGEL